MTCSIRNTYLVEWDTIICTVCYRHLVALFLSPFSLDHQLEVFCEFDAPNNLVTTELPRSALLQYQQPQFAYITTLRDRMDGCEQILNLPCLIDGASFNRGQMSRYAAAEGSWVSASGQVVNFVYQQSINGTSSNCWIYPTDCRDESLR